MNDMRPTIKEIARRIAGRRKALGLTQAQVAERLQKSRAYVIALEGGTDVQPTVSVIYELAELFGCTAHDLMPAKPLAEERPEMRGCRVSEDAESEIARMLKEERDAW